MSQFRQRQIADAENRQYRSVVAVDRETSKLVARACGVRVIDAPRRESEYVLPVPAPPIHPYPPLENPASTVSKFDDAVKTDRAWMATQRAKFDRN